MATSGEVPAAERGIVTATLAFWICVGMSASRVRGRGGQNGTLVSRLVWTWRLNLDRWPSSSTHLPGQLDMRLHAQDQSNCLMTSCASHPPIPHLALIALPVHRPRGDWSMCMSLEYVYVTCSLTLSTDSVALRFGGMEMGPLN